jgi:hypothetical protein
MKLGIAILNLDNYISDEGLIPSSSLKWDGEQLRLQSGEKVWVEPIARQVSDILLVRSDLWKISKIRVSTTDWISARLPIFGVPFDVALHQLLSIRRLQQNPIKSVFQRIDGSHLESNRAGIVATMVAHLSFDRGGNRPEITLEMWQIPNINAETFYIHGIFLVNEGCFVHLDGATMYHDEMAIDRLFLHGRKTKGHQKAKYFRLDGPIAINDVRLLGSAFLPLEDLSSEYLLTQQNGGEA